MQLGKKKESTHIGKEEVNVFLFTDDMILHIRNPKEYTKKKKKIERMNSARLQVRRSVYKN